MLKPGHPAAAHAALPRPNPVAAVFGTVCYPHYFITSTGNVLEMMPAPKPDLCEIPATGKPEVRWFALKQYAANFAVIWLLILLFHVNRFYAFLKPETQTALLILAAGYTAGGLLWMLFFPAKMPESSACLAITAVARVVRDFKLRPAERAGQPRINQREKVALRILAVKIFFTPLMMNFLVMNFADVRERLSWPGDWFFAPEFFNQFIFPQAIAVIFFVDTFVFTFGYIVESKLLKSEVRSVEPTLLGWGVALMCYPPFNGVSTKYLGWYANQDATFDSEAATCALRIALVVLFAIYVWASIALGPKASNLTNRGIVAGGPYAFVRHPAYASKVLAWWVMFLAAPSLWGAASMLAWSFVYFMRAYTEERHLLLDPDYHVYCARVKNKFIPGVW